MDIMDTPQLIDNKYRFNICNSLQKCHDTRVKIYTYALNISVFLFVFVIFGGVLYYCYTKKLTPYEQHQKMYRDQQYVMSKIRYYQQETANRRMSDITNLPTMQ